jgi:hypothetical protein
MVASFVGSIQDRLIAEEAARRIPHPQVDP